MTNYTDLQEAGFPVDEATPEAILQSCGFICGTCRKLDALTTSTGMLARCSAKMVDGFAPGRAIETCSRYSANMVVTLGGAEVRLLD